MDTYNLAPYTPEDNDASTKLLNWSMGGVPSVNFGASKLIARFAQLLLTRKGSDRTDPQAGCGLTDLLGNVHTSERAYIQSEVSQALQDVNAQMMHENDPNVPAEARFVSAACDDVTIQEDRILVHFTIVSAARQRLEFQLPISIA
jgi:hypothetical protein